MAKFAISVKVDRRDLNELPRKVRKNVRAVMEEILTETYEMIRVPRAAGGLVPVRTGYLRSTVEVHEWPSINNLKGGLRATAPYAGYVEFGTVKMAAQPYMTPGAEYGRSEMQGPRMQRVIE